MAVVGLLDDKFVPADGETALVVGWGGLLDGGVWGEDSGLGYGLGSCAAMLRSSLMSRRSAPGSLALSSGSAW